MRRHLRALLPGTVVLATVAMIPVPAHAAAGAGSQAATGATAPGALTGRLLVTLRAPLRGGAHASAAHAVAARAGARIAATEPKLRLAELRPARGTSLAALAARVRRDQAVAHVEAERRMALRYVPNDPSLSQHEVSGPPDTIVEWWALRQNLPAAWDVARGENARVAVIDTGIDATHPELADRIAGHADFDATPEQGPATVDEVGHGTHVSSLACAATDNAAGLAGAGFGCRLLPVKTDLGEGSVARAIVWAVDQGAHAINMSFGTDGTRPAAAPVVAAVDYAVAHDVILVAAAADEPVEEQGDPANVLQPTGTGPDLAAGRGLTVTAADSRDERAGFAGRGTQISLAAYGTYGRGGPPGLLGAFPVNGTTLESGSFVAGQPPCECRTTFNGDNRYAYLQGTSMAAPVVAAVAAMVRDLNPDLRAPEVIRLLKETARRPAGAGWSPELGWGIVDGGAALVDARGRDRRAPTSRVHRIKRHRDGRVTLSWTQSDAGPPRVQSSGVAHVEVWRSAAGRPARRVATVRGARTHTLRLRAGQRYSFHTVAVDRAGNREPSPLHPDLRARGRRAR